MESIDLVIMISGRPTKKQIIFITDWIQEKVAVERFWGVESGLETKSLKLTF